MVKVSIIVPVHNSQNYLHKCVASLLDQTLDEIEIILVDDCSTDSSRELIGDYAKRYPPKDCSAIFEGEYPTGRCQKSGDGDRPG